MCDNILNIDKQEYNIKLIFILELMSLRSIHSPLHTSQSANCELGGTALAEILYLRLLPSTIKKSLFSRKKYTIFQTLCMIFRHINDIRNRGF